MYGRKPANAGKGSCGERTGCGCKKKGCGCKKKKTYVRKKK